MEVKQSRFIELRAAGQSYSKISKQLDVSKPTLIKWSNNLCNEIKNAKAQEIERIREEYHLSREHRTRVLGTQLSQIAKELLKRDLSEVPTWRLYEIQRKIMDKTEKEGGDIEFSREIQTGGSEYINKMLKKTVKWTG
jgi:DNA-binding transcriptional regulator YiaG